MSAGLDGIVSCANVVGADYTSCCAEPPCGQLNPSSELMYQVLFDAIGDAVDMFKSTSVPSSSSSSSSSSSFSSSPSSSPPPTGAGEFFHLGFDEVRGETRDERMELCVCVCACTPVYGDREVVMNDSDLLVYLVQCVCYCCSGAMYTFRPGLSNVCTSQTNMAV